MSNLQNVSFAPVGDFTGSTQRNPLDLRGEVPSPGLEALVALGVETALEYLSCGGQLVPILLTESVREITPNIRLFGDPLSIEVDLDAGLRHARTVVDDLGQSVVRYVWIFDGYAGTGIRHSDAIICEAAERSGSHGWQLAVRYRLQKTGVTVLDSAASVCASVAVPMCGVVVDAI